MAETPGEKVERLGREAIAEAEGQNSSDGTFSQDKLNQTFKEIQQTRRDGNLPRPTELD